MKFTDPRFLIPALSVTFVCDVASNAHCLNIDSDCGYYYVPIIVLATEGKIDFPVKLGGVGNYPPKVLLMNWE